MESKTNPGASVRETPYQKLKNFGRTVLVPSCVLFTVVCFIFAFAGTAAGAFAVMPKLSDMTLWFLFSVAVCWLNKIFSSHMHTAAKICIHYLGSLTAFIISFLVFNASFNNPPAGYTAACTLFTVIYAIAAGVKLTCSHIKNKKKTEHSEYKKQFG